MATDLYVELANGVHHLGDIALSDDIVSTLRRWASGEEFPINLIGARTGGTSSYPASEIDAFTFRRTR